MNNQLQSPLFKRLPLEIRQIIYAFSLTSNEPITNPVNCNTRRSNHQAPVLGLALLRACRRVSDEIDVVQFWSHNTFNFTSPTTASEFFRRLRKTGHIHQLASICFTIDDCLILIYGEPSRNSRWVEWDHYLTCTAKADVQIEMCVLNDDTHFAEDSHSLRGLKLLVLDIAQQQRHGSWRVKKERILQYMLPGFVGFLTSMANSGVETRLKALNNDDEEVEVTVPRSFDGIVKGAEVSMTVWLWSRIYGTSKPSLVDG